MNTIPSLSRLLDTKLIVEVVEGPVTSMDNMETLTISIPTDDYNHLASEDLEHGYFRPMIEALATKINSLGNVTTRAIPLPEKEMAWLCTKGRIPVMLRIVRREQPDRHQILMHALVQPTMDPKIASFLEPMKALMDEKTHKKGPVISKEEPESEAIPYYCCFNMCHADFEKWDVGHLRTFYLNPCVSAIVKGIKEEVANGQAVYPVLPGREECIQESDNFLRVTSKIPLAVGYYVHEEGHRFDVYASIKKVPQDG